MGKHSKDVMSRRVLLSMLVGGGAVAGVSIATSGRLYTPDELEARLALGPQGAVAPTTSPAPVAGATLTRSEAPTTSTTAAPRTTSRAPRTNAPTKTTAPRSELTADLAEQPRSGWGLRPGAAASSHLLATLFGITTVGGYRSTSAIENSDHLLGLASDFMTMNQKLNRDIGNFAIANRKLLRVKYAISLQHYNDGSGWTLMENRGSITANHFDHCHVSFY